MLCHWYRFCLIFFDLPNKELSLRYLVEVCFDLSTCLSPLLLLQQNEDWVGWTTDFFPPGLEAGVWSPGARCLGFWWGPASWPADGPLLGPLLAVARRQLSGVSPSKDTDSFGSGPHHMTSCHLNYFLNPNIVTLDFRMSAREFSRAVAQSIAPHIKITLYDSIFLSGIVTPFKECLLGVPLVMTDQWWTISGWLVGFLSENIFLSIQFQANFLLFSFSALEVRMPRILTSILKLGSTQSIIALLF